MTAVQFMQEHIIVGGFNQRLGQLSGFLGFIDLPVDLQVSQESDCESGCCADAEQAKRQELNEAIERARRNAERRSPIRIE